MPQVISPPSAWSSSAGNQPWPILPNQSGSMSASEEMIETPKKAWKVIVTSSMSSRIG